MPIEMGKDFNYTYPMGLDWKPGSKLSSRILEHIRSCASASKSSMEKRYHIYDKIDEKLTSYIAPTKKMKHKIEFQDEDAPLTVIVPISYAILDTILTYWLTAFADGPLFRYDAVGPEDKANAKLLEHIVNTQVRKSKMLLSLYVQWRDSIAYGYGVSSLRWDQRFGKRTRMMDGPIGIDPVTNLTILGKTPQTSRVKIFEGSVMDNIPVRNYFPDPEVPAHKIQEGEFVSFITQRSYMQLLAMEREQPEAYFNVQYLEHDIGESFLHEPPPDDNLVHPEDAVGGKSYGKNAHRLDILSFYTTIIPAEWGLGKSPFPEKWLFEVAGNNTIIRAQPMNLNHNMYPVTVCCPTFDGYSVAPVSLLEIIFELQNAIDWLWRSRFHNVRAGLNHRLVIDPWLARYDQAISGEPASAICIREHVWGRGVQNAVQQLQVSDVTASHINDIGALSDLIQRTTGAVDSVQGVVRPSGERRSATEMRDTRMSAISRIQKGARLGSIQSMHDLGYMLAHHQQQFMEEDMYVQLVGENARDLMLAFGEEYVSVRPEDLWIDFDVLPSDAVTPGGEYLPEIIQLFQMSHAHPATDQAFDATRQMLDIYRRAGVKGAYQFLVLPDEQAQEMASEFSGVPTTMGSPNQLPESEDARPTPA